ncbi:MAG: pyridoxal 5'-phosphate synthase glutaminase subunit PdxT [Acidobacteria bacterium]|nr:pyridoxal 5'-phosphate synthase glutaminase subunit PdxT [Acidobacteriota bacterium]MBI3656274.1 pyridoxal 5'-phosphate synthase glutaminase subunit PdxT [Acidobacteriota bacterium]
MKIGVLSLQGDFEAHTRVLARLDMPYCEIRHPEQLRDTDGLILPGGESTTMVKFIQAAGFEPALKAYAKARRPIFGTCAGAILLAAEVIDRPQFSLGLIDLVVRRNAYGRQVDSFIEVGPCAGFNEPLEMVFIRAPIIESVGPSVSVLARAQNRPVLVRSGNILVSTFHPELTVDNRVHAYFLAMAH